MKKLHNKKGFSLVELLAVVCIMGIVLGVGTFTYKAIVTNSSNKTCSTNIEAIKAAASSYRTVHGQDTVPDLATLADYMSDDVIPACPYADVDNNGEAVSGQAYEIYVQENGSIKVVCPFTNDGTDSDLTHEHIPKEAEEYGWTITGTLLE